MVSSSLLLRGSPLLLVSILVFVLLPGTTLAVKEHDFKKVDQSSFGRRLRSLSSRAREAGKNWHSPYSLGEAVFSTHDTTQATWAFDVHSALHPDIKFNLVLDVLEKVAPANTDEDGYITRMRIDEVDSHTQWKRYNETARWALVNAQPDIASLSAHKDIKLTSANGVTKITSPGQEIYIQHTPMKVSIRRAGEDVLVFNDRALFHMEHFRPRDDDKPDEGQSPEANGEQKVLEAKVKERDTAWFEGEPDGDLWTETWKTWTDSKPKGPEGFSIDISFPGAEHIYGLAEHAAPLALPSTDGSGAFTEPYRMWNSDIFEYLASSTMSLYGNIPLIQAHAAKHSVGILSLVASETWVDVTHPSSGSQTHWFSESGIVDLLILPGPNPTALFRQYASLTGTTPLPALWSLAYHQCRWNYFDEADVMQVDRRFDEEDIPLDVTWLDIEYAAEHRYFDWNKKHFPDPVRMQEAIGSKGRKMVAIVDPHVKRSDDFRIYTDAQERDVITKKADGKTNFEGWCWPGSSIWVDFFNPNSWSWWVDMFSFNVWKDSTKFLHIWNDMNEPSVFDGPEISMPRDNLHHGGWEHRDIHNLNGMLFHKATHQAMQKRESPVAKRPFVLSRSFFAGSQRYGAIWTGDNLGTWEHMAGETAMLLSLNICGMTFSGADVGGFFGNPSVEMLVRWYQAGAFMPFFRAHAQIDAKRREPYLYEEPYKGMMRDAIRLRYQMLPIWYTAFYENSLTGAPPMRPQYAVFPTDKLGFAIDDQYYIGSSGLLFKPQTAQGAQSLDIYLSDNQPYYDYFTHHLYPAASSPRKINMATPLDKIPLLLQGGNILPIRNRVRRASTLMWADPFTLVAGLDKSGNAVGTLYLDDGDSYAYEKGEYVFRQFTITQTKKNHFTFTNTGATSENAWSEVIADVRVEKIVILGLPKTPQSITYQGQPLEFEYRAGSGSSSKKEGQASELVIKDPRAKIVADWQIEISL